MRVSVVLAIEPAWRTTYYLLPTTYYLLPTTYYLLPTTYYSTYYLLPTTYYLLPTTYCTTVLQYLRYYSTTVVQYCSASPPLPPCLYSTGTITVPLVPTSPHAATVPYCTVQHCASTRTRSSIAWNGAPEGVDIRTGGRSHPWQTGRVAAGWQQGRQPQFCTIGEVSRYIQVPSGTYRGTYR